MTTKSANPREDAATPGHRIRRQRSWRIEVELLQRLETEAHRNRRNTNDHLEFILEQYFLTIDSNKGAKKCAE